MKKLSVNLVAGKGDEPERLIKAMKEIKGVKKIEILSNDELLEITVTDEFDSHIIDVINDINNKTGYKAY